MFYVWKVASYWLSLEIPKVFVQIQEFIKYLSKFVL